MKKRLSITLLILSILVNIFNYNAYAQGVTYDIDFKESNNGVVKVLLNTEKDIKTKLIIENGEEKYVYNLSKNKEYISFPLQLGNGNYSVAIYENTAGSNYKKVYSEAQKVTVNVQNNIYLASTQQVEWNKDDKAIILAKNLVDTALKEKIRKSNNPKSTLTEREIIDTLYTYVIKNIDYDYNKIDSLSYDYIPKIDNVLIDKSGICFDYSVLLAAMLRSQEIPTKLIKGYSTTTDVYHAWNEIYLADEGRWIIVDTTYDAYMYKNNSEFALEKSANDYTKNLEF